MPIFLNDLDNDLVDALVKYEITKDGTRRVRVMNDLITAFQAIAPDGIFIRNHDEFDDLELLASHAADEWVDRFGSRADRRVVLIKMFPKAEAIIATLDRANEIVPYYDDGPYNGMNERTLENGGIFNSGPIDFTAISNTAKIVLNSINDIDAYGKAVQDALVAKDVIIT